MKILCFALLLFLPGRPGPCFPVLLNEGRLAYDDKKFDTAIKRWNGALKCPDADESRRALLRQWIDLAAERKKGAANTTPPKRRDFVEKFETPNGVPTGQVDWSAQYVEAEGMAVIDRVKYTSEAQAIAMATRGAEIVAYANLLEIAQGVRVQRSTTVRDLMTESDVVRTEVQGIVRGARRVGEPLEKAGMVHVRVRMPLYDLAPLAAKESGGIVATHPPDPRPQPVGWLLPPAPGDSAALLLRFDGGRFDPALSLVITDDSGLTLFDFAALVSPTGETARSSDWNGPKLEARAEQRADGTVRLLSNTDVVLSYLKQRALSGNTARPAVAFLP